MKTNILAVEKTLEEVGNYQMFKSIKLTQYL